MHQTQEKTLIYLFNFLFLFAFLLMQATPSQAQNKTLLDHVPKNLADDKKNNFFTVVIENDLFGKGTDQNYTSGVRATYFDVNASFPDVAHKIAELTPTFSINQTSSVFYSLGQNLYTPDDISQVTQDPNDRPWAAYLYASIGMASLTDNHIDELEAAIGVVGPWALGEQTQKFIHSHVSDSPTPHGWRNQLKNEPTLNLAWQRRWPEFWSKAAYGLRLSASPFFGISLGNVHTFANTGFSVRLRPASEMWQDMPARVRPAMPGTGFFEIPEKKWSWFLFGGVDGRAVARNIFLDGNSFRSSHDIDKRYFVGDANIGLALTYDQFRISYTLNHRTKEFKGQDDPDLFGAITLNYRF